MEDKTVQYSEILGAGAELLNFFAGEALTDKTLTLDELKDLRRKAREFKIAVEYAIARTEEALSVHIPGGDKEEKC